MSEKMYSVFIVDDEKLVREGLKLIFDWNANGFYICGDAANGREALPLILKTHADIVITDLKMPFKDGLELARAIAENQPSTKVIILTGHGTLSSAQEAIRANVFDFLLKPVDPDELGEVMLKLRSSLEQTKNFYPFEEEKSLLEAISLHDIKKTVNALHKAAESIKTLCSGTENEKLIYQKLLDTVYAKIRQSGYSELLPPPDNEVISSSESAQAIEKYIVDTMSEDLTHSPDIIVEKMKLYLKENYTKDITLKMLESKFFLSSSYISRIFKQYEGINYHAYLMNIRIEQAKKLLISTNQSVTHIGYTVGFKNYKHFSRSFKELTGLTPVDYRNEKHK